MNNYVFTLQLRNLYNNGVIIALRITLTYSSEKHLFLLLNIQLMAFGRNMDSVRLSEVISGKKFDYYSQFKICRMALRYGSYEAASQLLKKLKNETSGQISFHFEVYFENLERIANAENEINRIQIPDNISTLGNVLMNSTGIKPG